MMGEHGESIRFNYNIPDAAKEKIIDAAILCANAELPEGTTFEVRGKTRSFSDPEDYGIAWYTSDSVRASSRGNFRDAFCDAKEPDDIGCVLIARQTTGNLGEIQP